MRRGGRSLGARELGGDLRQLIETLLQRGVGREELADGGLAADGGDEGQMVRRGGRAQVLLRDLAHVPAQLRQRRGQSRRRTGENGRGTVGGELPVAGETGDEDEGESVDYGSEEEEERLDRGAGVIVVQLSDAQV